MRNEIKKDGQDKISVLEIYKEIGINYRYHLDRRHRVMTRYSIAMSAFYVSSGWMFINKIEKIAFLPFLFAAIASYVLSLMDKKNANTLTMCENYGKEIEKNAGRGFFTGHGIEKENVLEYTNILKWIFNCSIALNVMASACMFVYFSFGFYEPPGPCQ